MNILVRLPDFKMHIRDNKKPVGDTVVQLTARTIKKAFSWKAPATSNPFDIGINLAEEVIEFMISNEKFKIDGEALKHGDNFSLNVYNGYENVVWAMFNEPAFEEAKGIIEKRFSTLTLKQAAPDTFVIIPANPFSKIRSTKRLLFTDENQTIKRIQEGVNEIDQMFDLDPEIEMELIGKEIKHMNEVLISEDSDQLVYNFTEYEVKLDDQGNPIPCDIEGQIYCEHRLVKEYESNINEDAPLRFLKMIDPKELIDSWLLSKSYALSHVDGLQYRFLSDMAKYLQDSGKVALVSTKVNNVVQPLVLRDGGKPFYGWLEGRYEADEQGVITSYALILHEASMKLRD